MKPGNVIFVGAIIIVMVIFSVAYNFNRIRISDAICFPNQRVSGENISALNRIYVACYSYSDGGNIVEIKSRPESDFYQ
jgi:hypothetical protein